MQGAKVFAGKLLEAATAGGKVSSVVKSLKVKDKEMEGADFAQFKEAQKAEDLIGAMEEATAQGEVEVEALGALLQKVKPLLPPGASAEYFPVMYFIDKNATSMPATCGGTVTGTAMLGTLDDCAAVCDSLMGDCEGFSHYYVEDKKGMCFLFTKLESVTYYSGCDKEAKALVQIPKVDSATTCMAKFAKFEGTSLAPDGSGKCKQCLKTVKEAKRCFKLS